MTFPQCRSQQQLVVLHEPLPGGGELGVTHTLRRLRKRLVPRAQLERLRDHPRRTFRIGAVVVLHRRRAAQHVRQEAIDDRRPGEAVRPVPHQAHPPRHDQRERVDVRREVVVEVALEQEVGVGEPARSRSRATGRHLVHQRPVGHVDEREPDERALDQRVTVGERPADTQPPRPPTAHRRDHDHGLRAPMPIHPPQPTIARSRVRLSPRDLNPA